MASGPEERNRVFGIPTGGSPPRRQGEEQQHVLGFSAGWSDQIDLGGLRFLAHPIRSYRRWSRRRRLGPYATGEEDH